MRWHLFRPHAAPDGYRYVFSGTVPGAILAALETPESMVVVDRIDTSPVGRRYEIIL